MIENLEACKNWAVLIEICTPHRVDRFIEYTGAYLKKLDTSKPGKDMIENLEVGSHSEVAIPFKSFFSDLCS